MPTKTTRRGRAGARRQTTEQMRGRERMKYGSTPMSGRNKGTVGERVKRGASNITANARNLGNISSNSAKKAKKQVKSAVNKSRNTLKKARGGK